MAFTIESARLYGGQQLEAELASVFEDWLREDVNDKFLSEQFLTDRWQYPPPGTRRKNGQLAGNPRDIYDTGALFKSGQRSFDVETTSFKVEGSWHWNATNASGEEYAWFVHEGQGPYSRAPRPWTDELAVPYLFDYSEPKKDLELRITRGLK
jgi:hypothetical protein